MAEKQVWFISHSSGARHEVPAFFKALEEFSKQHTEFELRFPPDSPMAFEERKALLETSDLVIAEVSLASTGTGVDLGLAHGSGKNVIAFHTSTSAISPIVPVVATAIHAYLDSNKILEVLKTFT